MPAIIEASGVGSAMSTIERLRRRPDFLAAADGRRFHTERMTGQGRLRDAAAPDDPEALRVGFTITKRVGHATERNRIRRRLRAAVAAVAADLPTVPADIVLIARRPALDAAFDTLKDDLRRAVSAVVKPRGPDAGPRRKRPRPSDERPRPSDERPRPSDERGTPGGAPSQPTPHGRAAGSPASAASLPQPLSNACGGVPDGQ